MLQSVQWTSSEPHTPGWASRTNNNLAGQTHVPFTTLMRATTNCYLQDKTSQPP